MNKIQLAINVCLSIGVMALSLGLMLSGHYRLANEDKIRALETRADFHDEEMAEMLELSQIHGKQIRDLMKVVEEHQEALTKQGTLNTTILGITEALSKERK